MFHWLTDVVASTTTTITFFTIFLVGVAFSAFSLVLGGLGGHADHDVGHDIGHDTDAHDGSADHHGGDDGAQGGTLSVGMFSVRGVALLATGFGGAGFLIYVSTGKILFSTASALVGGYIFAFVVLYTLKVFKSQQANSMISMSAAIGADGIVTISIPEDGLGEVSLVVSGTEMFKPARSMNGRPIKSGARVQVSEVSGGTLVVTGKNSGSDG